MKTLFSQITVINMGPAIPAPDSYLFSVNVHFSPQSTWDPSLISVGSAAVVQSTGDTYEHNAGMADQGILESPVLKGNFTFTFFWNIIQNNIP